MAGSEQRAAQITTLLPEIHWISNEHWRNLVQQIWAEAWHLSKWGSPEEAPYNPVCPGVSLIDHTRAVVRGALELSNALRAVFPDLHVDRDTLLVTAILHDVSKLLEYEPGACNGSPGKSRLGELYQHGFLSAHYAQKAGFPPEVVGNLICHTAESKKPPRTVEGLLVYYADMADANIHRLLAGAPLLMDK